jgi:hypothetical protein
VSDAAHVAGPGSHAPPGFARGLSQASTAVTWWPLLPLGVLIVFLIVGVVCAVRDGRHHESEDSALDAPDHARRDASRDVYLRCWL